MSRLATVSGLEVAVLDEFEVADMFWGADEAEVVVDDEAPNQLNRWLSFLAAGWLPEAGDSCEDDAPLLTPKTDAMPCGSLTAGDADASKSKFCDTGPFALKSSSTFSD